MASTRETGTTRIPGVYHQPREPHGIQGGLQSGEKWQKLSLWADDRNSNQWKTWIGLCTESRYTGPWLFSSLRRENNCFPSGVGAPDVMVMRGGNVEIKDHPEENEWRLFIQFAAARGPPSPLGLAETPRHAGAWEARGKASGAPWLGQLTGAAGVRLTRRGQLLWLVWATYLACSGWSWVESGDKYQEAGSQWPRQVWADSCALVPWEVCLSLCQALYHENMQKGPLCPQGSFSWASRWRGKQLFSQPRGWEI